MQEHGLEVGLVDLNRADRHVLPAVLETANRAGASVNSVEVKEADLEAVFLHLTGTALRE